MNWSIAAVIVSSCGLIVTLLVGAYNSGRFTQRIDGHDKKFAEGDRRMDKQDGVIAGVAEKVEDASMRLVRLEEWKNGFNAAARVSGREDLKTS